ncbi:MAG: Ig domain-containing protein [Lachnospiraceae bacterium]|nr:Ig domain-containing protein [Lachnospiraceae bacterium]
MFVIILLISGIFLTIIAIILAVSKQSTAGTIVSALFALLAYFVSLYPLIFNQEKTEPNIVLNSKSLSMISTDEYDLKTIISPDNCEIKWSSDNTAIVTVDNRGHLKAINEGNATITATVVYKSVEYTDICNVTVNNPTINLGDASLLHVGETDILSVATIPENASINWNSSNLDIVSVNEAGKIKGISEGTATITATMIYNNVSYSADCAIDVTTFIEESDKNINDNIESDEQETITSEIEQNSDEQETIISEIEQNSDVQESDITTISIRDVAWLDDEKIYKDDYATTMRGEEWSDCIRFGSSNINSDGTSVLRVVCDKKFSKFTAEIAPQEGFDKTETVTFYIYGGTDDQQTFKDEFQIDYSTKSFKVEYDISDTEELYFWKSGNYNQGRIAGQFINGYTGMGVLMRDAVLYK